MLAGPGSLTLYLYRQNETLGPWLINKSDLYNGLQQLCSSLHLKKHLVCIVLAITITSSQRSNAQGKKADEVCPIRREPQWRRAGRQRGTGERNNKHGQELPRAAHPQLLAA